MDTMCLSMFELIQLSIAAMVERLRGDDHSFGMINGLGMQLASHSYAVYSTTPGAVRLPDQRSVQADLDARAPARPGALPASTIASVTRIIGSPAEPSSRSTASCCLNSTSWSRQAVPAS